VLVQSYARTITPTQGHACSALAFQKVGRFLSVRGGGEDEPPVVLLISTEN